MPLALSLVPIDRQFDGCRSVMFVACNVCPRMHFAWEHHERLFSPAMLLGREDSFRPPSERAATGRRASRPAKRRVPDVARIGGLLVVNRAGPEVQARRGRLRRDWRGRLRIGRQDGFPGLPREARRATRPRRRHRQLHPADRVASDGGNHRGDADSKRGNPRPRLERGSGRRRAHPRG